MIKDFDDFEMDADSETLTRAKAAASTNDPQDIVDAYNMLAGGFGSGSYGIGGSVYGFDSDPFGFDLF